MLGSRWMGYNTWIHKIVNKAENTSPTVEGTTARLFPGHHVKYLTRRPHIKWTGCGIDGQQM